MTGRTRVALLGVAGLAAAVVLGLTGYLVSRETIAAPATSLSAGEGLAPTRPPARVAPPASRPQRRAGRPTRPTTTATTGAATTTDDDDGSGRGRSRNRNRSGSDDGSDDGSGSGSGSSGGSSGSSGGGDDD